MVEPKAGNDVWLSLDRDLQKAIYHILEKQLAGILTNVLVNQEPEEIKNVDASEIKLPIKDAYFQLINNNVLSFHDFASEEPLTQNGRLTPSLKAPEQGLRRT